MNGLTKVIKIALDCRLFIPVLIPVLIPEILSCPDQSSQYCDNTSEIPEEAGSAMSLIEVSLIEAGSAWI